MYDSLYVCVVIKIGFCFLIKRLQLPIFFFKYVDIELLLILLPTFIKQRLSNNSTNTHDLANAVAWRNSDNNTDTKIIYEFPFITNVSKWKIWDARRDWTFTNYHVWFGDTETSLTKYATYSFNPTTVWNNATPNSQTRTLSPVKETKYMAFSFDDISTNPSTGQGTAGPGVAEIKIWGYPSSTVSY